VKLHNIQAVDINVLRLSSPPLRLFVPSLLSSPPHLSSPFPPEVRYRRFVYQFNHLPYFQPWTPYAPRLPQNHYTPKCCALSPGTAATGPVPGLESGSPPLHHNHIRGMVILSISLIYIGSLSHIFDNTHTHPPTIHSTDNITLIRRYHTHPPTIHSPHHLNRLTPQSVLFTTLLISYNNSSSSPPLLIRPPHPCDDYLQIHEIFNIPSKIG
jgi:hypothetical protein